MCGNIIVQVHIFYMGDSRTSDLDDVVLGWVDGRLVTVSISSSSFAALILMCMKRSAFFENKHGSAYI